MGRGRAFSPLEERLLLENYDKTIVELEALLAANGYQRSRKSINRKLEKMRTDGSIGFRSKDTIRRSYRQRTRRTQEVTSPESGFGKKGGFGSNSGWGDEE